MKQYNKNHIFTYLRFYGDKIPHRYFEQHQLFFMRYQKECKRQKINILELTRYAVQNGWLKSHGRDFYEKNFPMREFVLTEKGDLLYRSLAVERGGAYSHYRYFKRDEER